MNLEIMKFIATLSPKAKLCLAAFLITGYLGVNYGMAYHASKNGLGFENNFLRIKITPKGQDEQAPVVNPSPASPQQSTAPSAVQPAEGAVV